MDTDKETLDQLERMGTGTYERLAEVKARVASLLHANEYLAKKVVRLQVERDAYEVSLRTISKHIGTECGDVTDDTPERDMRHALYAITAMLEDSTDCGPCGECESFECASVKHYPDGGCPDNPPLCGLCSGSGEGMADGTICSHCHGGGTEPGVYEA